MALKATAALRNASGLDPGSFTAFISSPNLSAAWGDLGIGAVAGGGCAAGLIGTTEFGAESPPLRPQPRCEPEAAIR